MNDYFRRMIYCEEKQLEREWMKNGNILGDVQLIKRCIVLDKAKFLLECEDREE